MKKTDLEEFLSAVEDMVNYWNHRANNVTYSYEGFEVYDICSNDLFTCSRRIWKNLIPEQVEQFIIALEELANSWISLSNSKFLFVKDADILRLCADELRGTINAGFNSSSN